MEFSRWLPWYRRIVSEFGYSIEKDREATHVLRELLAPKARPLTDLRREIHDRHIIVFGAGSSLEENLSELVKRSLQKYFISVAADGATSAFMRRSITPRIIVTDLDGRIEDIIEACNRGSIVVIHAHGDNIDAMLKWVPKIMENNEAKLFGTSQVEPSPPVIHNFGGFTDGDRAAFLAEEMDARTITLAGMDLGETIGKYSKHRSSKQLSRQEKDKWLTNKRTKLRFAKELLEWLATWPKAAGRLFNATGPNGETIRGFTSIEFKKLRKATISTK